MTTLSTPWPYHRRTLATAFASSAWTIKSASLSRRSFLKLGHGDLHQDDRAVEVFVARMLNHPQYSGMIRAMVQPAFSELLRAIEAKRGNILGRSDVEQILRAAVAAVASGEESRCRISGTLLAYLILEKRRIAATLPDCDGCWNVSRGLFRRKLFERLSGNCPSEISGPADADFERSAHFVCFDGLANYRICRVA
jgi:hypothetical protein